MKNGKLRRAIIVTLITVLSPFVIWYMISDVKTYYKVEQMHQRMTRVPLDTEVKEFTEFSIKLNNLRVKKENGIELTTADENNLLDWKKKVDGYKERWSLPVN